LPKKRRLGEVERKVPFTRKENLYRRTWDLNWGLKNNEKSSFIGMGGTNTTKNTPGNRK